MQLKLFTILCSLAIGITAAHVRREGGGEQASTSASTCSDITKTVTAIATISYGVTRTTTVTVVKTETDEVTKTDTVTTVKPGPTQTVSYTVTSKGPDTTVTVTKTESYTITTTKPGPTCATSKPNCSTLTSTATYCKSCLVPDCTTTSSITKSAGCDVLSTAVVSFPCDSPDSCQKIGCKTVYAIQTGQA
ncbi:hypothetical protein N8I77_006748 [Diaporthe amygdali]|uniref:Uncharacterized protein n=1 Tax=Phomopsis amygdali TaxID=1214568 RepID=A0AAD9SIM3_PHOAM|nr:hypothetical protein N8I77_006748 [Diaporthe amygdali]